MLSTFTLKNGVKVATYSIPQMRSVFLEVSAKCGSIFDPPGKSGAAHFMEHSLVQGIPSLPTPESFSEYVESLAGSYNASTSSELIRFYINLPATHIEDALRIASEVFYEPLFAEEAIEKERKAIMTEIFEQQNSVYYKNGEFWRQVRYKKGHPLIRFNGGLPADIAKLSKTDLVDFWKKFFIPKNTYVVLVGGFNNTEAKKLLETFFAKNRSHQSFPDFPDLTNAHLSTRTVALRGDDKLNAVYIDLTFPTIPEEVDLQKSLPQTLIKSILGGLRSSRLYKLLRQQRGLVYHVGVGSIAFQKFSIFDVNTEVSKEKLDEVLELIVKEMSAFLKNGPTEEEIEFAKNFHINRVLMQFDHPSNIASWISTDLLWEEKAYTPEEYAKLIEVITHQDIMNLMRKYWDLNKLNLTIQGPVDNSKANIAKYKRVVSILK